MEVEKKCNTITGTHDWILSTIQNSQSEMLKTELRKDIDKMQQDIFAATNELQSAKRDHERIAEKMRGSNEFMLNTNCLADSQYAEGLTTVHPAPVEHPVCPASLFVSIECILDSIRSHVHEGFACIGVHGSTQGSKVVKHNLEEKPIRIPRRPELSRGYLEANKEKPIPMLRPLLSSLDLEDKEGKKEEGQSSLPLESKEDVGDSYDEDECKSDGDSIPHGKANGSDSLPQGKAISKNQNAQRMLYKQKKKSKQDGKKDEAPISLDSEDSKELSMEDLDSTEVEKEANIGREEETRLHEQQEWIRGDLIVAGYTPDEALKALNTRAKVQGHEELTFVELGTNNTTVWEATSVEPTTKTTVQEHEVTTAATSAKVTAKLEHKATTIKEHKTTFSSSIAEEHNAATVEVANVDKLEEATRDIDGDNLNLSSFILAGFKMRKSRSPPTHNGFDLVNLPKTRSRSK
ncbi:hypothetical protein L7F22_007702 [Adiantum nelumboides]|nr:hypothetical protein [Adiantum nelumboides]